PVSRLVLGFCPVLLFFSACFRSSSVINLVCSSSFLVFSIFFNYRLCSGSSFSFALCINFSFSFKSFFLSSLLLLGYILFFSVNFSCFFLYQVIKFVICLFLSQSAFSHTTGKVV